MKSSPCIRPFEIRFLPVEDLVPAPYNPRQVLTPTSRAYRNLERSLREFGLVEPLIWNERTRHVVGGHARLAILRSMKVREVPVSVVNLDPVREKALNVVLNNQEAQSRYDPERLADLLDELEDLPELELTGFDPGDLSPLRLEPVSELAPPEERDTITIALEIPRDALELLRPRIDALVAEFDLTTHVQSA